MGGFEGGLRNERHGAEQCIFFVYPTFFFSLLYPIYLGTCYERSVFLLVDQHTTASKYNLGHFSLSPFGPHIWSSSDTQLATLPAS